MRAIDTSVFEFLIAQRTYTIPVYQRNYDWKETHCKKLLFDIIKAGKSPQEPEYFLGSFVIVQKDIKDPFNFYIIDGQQRLTSLTLLLLAIYHSNTEIARGATPQIEKLIFSNISSSEKRLILKQIQKDDAYLYKIIQNEEFHVDDSNILNNYTFFSKYVDENPEDTLVILESITHKLRVVQITLQEHDQPQLVFETLNATGKGLSEADKIRNYILMYKDQEKLYEKYWVKIEENCLQNQDPGRISDFMKSFLTIEFREYVTKPIKDADVYKVFKDYVETCKKNNEEILQLILEYSSCYNTILTADLDTKDKQLISSLKNIKRFGFTALDSIILCILKHKHDMIISVDCATNMIFLLENYLIRRLICSLPSNALNKVSFALIKKVLSQDSEENIKKLFEQSLLSFQGSARFPIDEHFLEIIVTRKMLNNEQLYNYLFDICLIKIEWS
jgi:uncharacterized protein with ParB-like and HNH nuclease domain